MLQQRQERLHQLAGHRRRARLLRRADHRRHEREDGGAVGDVAGARLLEQHGQQRGQRGLQQRQPAAPHDLLQQLQAVRVQVHRLAGQRRQRRRHRAAHAGGLRCGQPASPTSCSATTPLLSITTFCTHDSASERVSGVAARSAIWRSSV